MKYQRLFSLLPVAAVAVLGMAGKAQAGAYGYSFNDINNLTTTFTCSTSGVNCSGDLVIDNYQSSSQSDANLDPNNTAGVSGGQVFSGPPFPVADPDALVSFQTDGVVAAPANNAFGAIGIVAGADYARGDAQIVQQGINALFDANASNVTHAINVAEGQITDDPAAFANGSNTSTTGFEMTFTVSDTFFIDFAATAAPFMESFIDPGATSTTDLDVSITINDGNGVVFNWSPDGSGAGAITGGVATADEATLNVELQDTNDADGLSEFYDPIAAGLCALGATALCDYAATTASFGPGSYTLILTMHEGIVLAQQRQIPEPGTLALMGLGLLSLTFARKSRKKA